MICEAIEQKFCSNWTFIQLVQAEDLGALLCLHHPVRVQCFALDPHHVSGWPQILLFFRFTLVSPKSSVVARDTLYF
jgi:hypothetical protein